MGKQKVLTSIDLLLDNGFIQYEGFEQSTKGSNHRTYRVVYPETIDTVRALMPILPRPPSKTAKILSNHKSYIEEVDSSEELEILIPKNNFTKKQQSLKHETDGFICKRADYKLLC